MQQKIVLDTNIWVKAIIDKEYDLDCDDALHVFLHNKDYILALDYDGEIEREYRDNIKSNKRHFECRMKQLEREQRKYWCDSKLNGDQKAMLLKLGFHEMEDHIFVGTAMSADKIIVTEDSDYGVHGENEYEEVHTYMKKDMGLNVFTAEAFSKDFSS